MENKEFIIPISVISPIDIARISHELENLDEFFRQQQIRSGEAPQATPRYSRLLDEIVLANGLNLLDANDRNKLKVDLDNTAKTSPVLHISFSADPPGTYIQKIVDWLRQNIDRRILVRVGLQPNIGAGCVVRTTNKHFDFSLRKYFDSKHEFFMKKLHEVVAPELQPVAAGNVPADEVISNSQIEVEQKVADTSGKEQPANQPENKS